MSTDPTPPAAPRTPRLTDDNGLPPVPKKYEGMSWSDIAAWMRMQKQDKEIEDLKAESQRLKDAARACLGRIKLTRGRTSPVLTEIMATLDKALSSEAHPHA